MNRHCFALDLINDAELISAYKRHHENVWPEIVESIKESGILALEMYLVQNRLFMIMDVSDEFSFEAKDEADLNNPIVQEWETLMWKYQQALPIAKKGEKWLLMEKIYELKA